MGGGSEVKDEILVKEAKNVEWLVEMVDSSDPETGSFPRIRKVPIVIREKDNNKGCFDPSLVSLGPYHHGEERLKPMEPYKGFTARWFISLSAGVKSSHEDWKCKVSEIYKKFEDELRSNSTNRRNNPNPTEATSCSTDLKYSWYAADESIEYLNDKDFVRMMFLDGCFILYVIHQLIYTSDSMNDPIVKEPCIVTDMFLLENQVPYVVLKALMSLMWQQPNDHGSNNQSYGKGKKDQGRAIQRKDIEDFVEAMFHMEIESIDLSSSWFYHLFEIFGKISRKLGGRRYSGNTVVGSNLIGRENIGNEPLPLHLLDILRNKLIGDAFTPSCNWARDAYFRSVTELKTAGIELCKSHSNEITAVNFTKGFFHGRLLLPQLRVALHTKTWLLNLMAYERCSEWPLIYGRVVNSYVWLLDCLINHSDDVKELRYKGILDNCLGSDDEVAKLFNELGNSVWPDSLVYADVRNSIHRHCRTSFKVKVGTWFDEMRNTYFRSPWTVISLIAAIILLFLAAVQTFFTVWPP